VARREYTGVYPYTLAGGRVLYRTLFTDSNGVQRQKRGFKTPTAAKFRAEMLVRADLGTLRISHELFSVHFDTWLASHHRASSGTRADYRRHGDLRLKPFFGSMRLSAIHVHTVRSFVAEMARLVDQDKIAAKTVNNTLGCLSTCLKDAVTLGKTRPTRATTSSACLSPTSNATGCGRRDSTLPRCMPDPLSAARGTADRNRHANQRSARTALGRRRPRTQRHPCPPPTDPSRRQPHQEPAVPARVGRRRMLSLLRDLYARQSELYDFDLTRHHLFPTLARPSGDKLDRSRANVTVKQIDRSTVPRDWHKQALKDAGLRDMPLHSLRHTAAASWLLAGQPLIYVQRQLGHSSITTTERYYGHLEQTFAHTAANATEAAIWKTPD